MRAGHSPPDDADLGAVDLALGAVDVRDAFSEVELCVLLGADALDGDERGVWARVALAALVAEDAALCVQSANVARVSADTRNRGARGRGRTVWKACGES